METVARNAKLREERFSAVAVGRIRIRRQESGGICSCRQRKIPGVCGSSGLRTKLGVNVEVAAAASGSARFQGIVEVIVGRIRILR